MINLDNSIIISRKEYFPILFCLKNENNNCDIKIISDSDLFNMLSFRYKNNPISYLINKYNYDYNHAKYYLNVLRKSEYKNDHLLNMLYTNLSNNDYLEYDLYGKYELKQRNIILFEMDNNIEVQNILKSNNLNYSNLYLSDCKKPNEMLKKAYYFDNKYDQYFYIFNDIKNKLIKDESIKENIKILINNEADLFYINLLSNLFNIPCLYQKTTNLREIRSVSNKLEEIYKNKEFRFNEEELKDENLKKVFDLYNEYDLNKISFASSYNNIIQILEDIRVKEIVSNKGIKIIDNYIIDPNSIIYVTNFDYDNFYNVLIDNKILADEVLAKVKANTSYNKTKIDEKFKENYLLYSNISMLSRVKRHLSDKIHDSAYFNKYNIQIIEPELNYNNLNLKSLNLYNQLILDNNHIMKKIVLNDKQYNYYDNSYTGISTDYFKKKKWSVTDIEQYIDCPFKYYLKKFIKMTDDEGYNQARGSLIHKVFERIYHENFDYNKAFEEGIEEYKKNKISNKKQFTIKDEIYIEIIRHWLFVFVYAHKEQAKMVKVPDGFKDAEVEIPYNVLDYEFNGRIDKIVLSEPNYYSLIDYKSGKETFNATILFLGKSIQLPLYYYAEENDPKFDYNFGGLYICHNYASSFKAFSNYAASPNDVIYKYDKLKDFMRFDGIYFNNEAYLSKLQTKENTLIKKNVYFDEKGQIGVSGNNKLKNYYVTTKRIIDDSLEGVKRTISNIEENNFEIAPTGLDLKSISSDSIACKFCDYKSVCFVKKENYVSYRKEIEEHMKTGGRKQ